MLGGYEENAMTQNGREVDRLKGRLEAVLITVGNHAGHLGSSLGPSIDGGKPPIDKLDHLAAITRDNPSYSEIRHLAEEGARLIRLYNAKPEAPKVFVREILDGAVAVMVSLDRIRNTLLANAAASQHLAEMRARTGGEAALMTGQQKVLSSHESECQKITAKSSSVVFQKIVRLLETYTKTILLIGFVVAILIYALLFASTR